MRHAFLAGFSKISRRRSAGLNPRRSKSVNIFLVEGRRAIPSTALILAKPTKPNVRVFGLAAFLGLVLFLALAVFVTSCGIGSLYRTPQKIRGCMQLQPASDGGLRCTDRPYGASPI